MEALPGAFTVRIACAAMRHLFLLVVCVLGFVSAGCRHAGIPTWPASHGHLSRSIEKHLDAPATANRHYPLGSHWVPSVELSLEEARDVYPEARKVLLGKPSSEQVKHAVDDLSAACRANLDEACTFLREHFTGPVKLSGPAPVMTREAMDNRILALVGLRARLGPNGRAHDFVVLESAPYGMTEAVIQSLKAAKYEPAKVAGHPIEIPYTFIVRVKYSGDALTQAQELAWARARAARFPKSPMAWLDLSWLLAKDAPEDPGYAQALLHAHALEPTYWWPASELAWVRAQEGRFAEAEPLAKVALIEAPENPYALESAALVAFHQGRCSEAVDLQQRAVAKLPEPWPQEEHARFKQALETYRSKCLAGGAPANG